MPKRQSTDAQMARLRQAGTGEKYTEALRAVQSPQPNRFRMFSSRGSGWDPITRRAARQIAQIWPAGPGPHWEEKFGELCWKTFPWRDAPAEAVAVLKKAFAEAAATCQTCPSPGRKRVVWIWDSEYGWVTPWVKTCCASCYWVPKNLTTDSRYRDLREAYEEPEPEPEPGFEAIGCCTPNKRVASEVRAQFDRDGVAALLVKLEELRESMWSRSPHYDVFSGHGVKMAAEWACQPLLYRMRQQGVWSEPLLPEAERRQVSKALNSLSDTFFKMTAEELRD